MESTGDSWRHVLKNYIRSIEIISETAFKQIKRDRIQNHLPFDDSFKHSILGLTTARIANVYTNLLYEEILEDGQNLSNRNDNHQSFGNDHVSIGQQMTSRIISAESIEQMPIILEQSNSPNTASKSAENIRPLEVESDANQASSDQSIRFGPSGMNGVNALQDVSGGRLLEPSQNENSDQLNSVDGGGDGNELIIESSKNIVSNQEFDEAFERVPELINLISDDEEIVSQAVNNIPEEVQSVTDQLQPIVQRRNMVNDSAAGSVQFKKRFKLASSAGTVKRHKCDFCKFSTEIKSNLMMHIRTHANERPYECEICDKNFTQKAHLNGHMKTHRSLFQFQCSTCRQGFSDEKQRKSHEMRCKAKGYECYLCKQFTLKKLHLVDHLRKHTGEKLRCSMCRKPFRSNCNLARHMKLHGNLFRFQCSNCLQGFSEKTQWKSHESRCKLKQYECFLCSKKFHQQKGNLLRHMRSKHT